MRSTRRPSSHASTGACSDFSERTHLISRTYAYHGTHGFGTSLAMEPLRQGYGPLVDSVSHVAYDSPEALADEIERVGPDRVAAFFCEPVIGAGGVRPAPPGYLEAVAAICKRHGVLLVIDSVIGGFGRLGHAGSGTSASTSSPTWSCSPRASRAATCRSAPCS